MDGSQPSAPPPPPRFESLHLPRGEAGAASVGRSERQSAGESLAAHLGLAESVPCDVSLGTSTECVCVFILGGVGFTRPMIRRPPLLAGAVAWGGSFSWVWVKFHPPGTGPQAEMSMFPFTRASHFGVTLVLSNSQMSPMQRAVFTSKCVLLGFRVPPCLSLRVLHIANT